MFYFHFLNSPDGSCINEISIAQSIISQALPALSPRLNLTFSPHKPSDKTRLVDNTNYSQSNLEMSKFNLTNEMPVTSSLQANLSQLQATIDASQSKNEEANQSECKTDETKQQTVVTPNKWPLKPGVLVHVNSNHTLSPKNQARLQTIAKTTNDDVNDQEDANLGLLERNRTNKDRNEDTEQSGCTVEYAKINKQRKQPKNKVTDILKNLRKKYSDSDDESGKYKKINKSNKRAVSLVNMNKSGYMVPKNRLKSFFQSETPNVIVTEGGSY